MKCAYKIRKIIYAISFAKCFTKIRLFAPLKSSFTLVLDCFGWLSDIAIESWRTRNLFNRHFNLRYLNFKGKKLYTL